MASQMTCNKSEMWGRKMPEGLDFEISQCPLTMRSVVNLIIAMERLKGGKTEEVLSTEFRDENLLNIMLDSIVEERIVFERSSTPPAQFSRTNEHQCSVTDSQQRSLILVQNSMELNAVMLQGGSENRKVHLNMSTYVHPTPSTEARPVTLGIKGTDLYLACYKNGDKPTLHLEPVADKASLLRISAESDLVRFLFYKHDTGLNDSTLMSARFPDWYISTATQDNKPVEMCQETASRYRTFRIQRQS
ncbi:interleukin-1 beta-like [Odontesthes bonariensis]|uniref:interleukin-1 beta-like n=1 Tax=Odontesthes bonariensis TaxID=219752 RepID=UPI003F58E80B